MIVGCTSGYGSALASVCKRDGWTIVGISRSKPESSLLDTHYVVSDFRNLDDYKKDIETVLREQIDVDLVVFVAGSVVLKSKNEYAQNDIQEVYANNFGYVYETIRKCDELGLSPDIITFGSQWSYREGEDLLYWYSIMKHALKNLILSYNSKKPEQTLQHFCVPTTKTDTAIKILEFASKISFNKLDFDDSITTEIVGKELMASYLNKKDERLFVWKDGLFVAIPPTEAKTKFDSIFAGLEKYSYQDIINNI